LAVDAEFRDEIIPRSEEAGFLLMGQARFTWDGKDKLSISSDRLTSSFGQVELKGDVILKKELDISIKGSVSDVKEARSFTSLILQRKLKFPEISGEGEASIQIKGDHIFPHIRLIFSLSPGGFEDFQGRSVYGEAEIIRDEFVGNFQVEDPVYTGKIGVFAKDEDVEAYFHVLHGRVQDILIGLDIPFPVQGEASGDFTYKGRDKKFQLEGEFSGSDMKLAGLSLKNVQGEMRATDHSVSFPQIECEVSGGEVKGSVTLDFIEREFGIDIQGEEVDLSDWNPGYKGSLSFNVNGGGKVNQERAEGKLLIHDLEIPPFQKTRMEGDIQLSMTDDGLNLKTDGNFFPGENEFNVDLNLPMGEKEITATIKGAFRNLDLLIPWNGAEGVVKYMADLKVQDRIPKLKGVLDLQGEVFPFPRFAHAVRNFSGLVFFEDGMFSLRSLKGEMGDGPVQASGSFQIGKNGLEDIAIQAQGTQMQLSILERTRALTDGNLILTKNSETFELGGNFNIQNLVWTREFNEKIVFSSDPYYESGREPGFFDGMNLKVRLVADDNVMFENSLGKFMGRFDLVIRGNINSPVLMGEMEALDGEVFFQDRSFEILRGKVSFFNPTATEPYINFNGETYIKDYRVMFSLDGFMDNLNPVFGSSPPLPPEDVLALLALGEAFRRTYHYDRSSQQGTASLLSFQLYEEAQRRAEKLFGIDRFRIDPFVLGSSAEMTARLTVGKKISRNFFILYSTNLSSQREEITRIEWELTRDLSIVGTKDEEGRISIDVKIHKRF
jgi:autotransporter translocation and assembly factor TamB